MLRNVMLHNVMLRYIMLRNVMLRNVMMTSCWQNLTSKSQKQILEVSKDNQQY